MGVLKTITDEYFGKNLREEYLKIMDEAEGLHDSSAFDKVLLLAKDGLPEAQYFVGRHYMCDDYNDIQAEHWLRLAAEQHYPPAELALGEWLYAGTYNLKNEPECEQWLLLADRHGQTDACYFLGKLAEDKGDMAEACRWWKKGAENHDGYSQEKLAFCYETGQGVPYDIDAAIVWYKQAALNGHFIGYADVSYQIAVLKKYAMEKFADLNGYTSDRFWEGEKEMLNGNLAKAVSLWHWTPDPRAMVMAAWQMIHVVEGIVENDGEEYFDDELFPEEEEVEIKTVAEFFSKHKHPAAYYLKGYLYESNICYIKKNMTRARHWYEKAAAAGDEVAEWKLELLEMMNPKRKTTVIKPYRLKHKKTGLYYNNGTLSELGQIYRHPNNYFTYMGKEPFILQIKYNGETHKAHKEILDELDEFKNKRSNRWPKSTPIGIKVCASDFEKEYLELKEMKRRKKD